MTDDDVDSVLALNEESVKALATMAPDDLAQYRRLTPYTSVCEVDSEVAAMWNAIKGDNPHIKYHSARRGYIACTATPSTMRADFKILDRVMIPDRQIQACGSLVVEAGRPGSSTD